MCTCKAAKLRMNTLITGYTKIKGWKRASFLYLSFISRSRFSVSLGESEQASERKRMKRESGEWNFMEGVGVFCAYYLFITFARGTERTNETKDTTWKISHTKITHTLIFLKLPFRCFFCPVARRRGLGRRRRRRSRRCHHFLRRSRSALRRRKRVQMGTRGETDRYTGDDEACINVCLCAIFHRTDRLRAPKVSGRVRGRVRMHGYSIV